MMDKAVIEYRKRRQERLDIRRGVAVNRYDGVEAFKKRRESRLEERMDANPRVAYGIAKGMGIDTTGMSPGEVYEAIAKNGGNARGKRPHGNDRPGKSELQRSAKTRQKENKGQRMPALKKGAMYDTSVYKEVGRIADKLGLQDKYDKITKGLTGKDVVYQKGADGKVVGSIPGLAGKVDNKMPKGASPELQKIYDAKIADGKKITDSMINITDGAGCRLLGLENNFKGASSAFGKIGRKRKSDSESENAALRERAKNWSDEDYMKSFGDITRFTVESDHKNMAKTVNNIMENMEKRGYKVEDVENKFFPPKPDKKTGEVPPHTYKAIHVTGVSPNGQRFEVQIHSKDTIAVKNKNHAAYEEWRDTKTSPERKAVLAEQMARAWDNTPDPEGILKIGRPKK